MLWQSIKRGDPEVGVAVMKNNDTVALVDGDLVIFDLAAAAADLGNAVKGAGTTATQLICAGVVKGRDIAVGDYGWIQTYGAHNNVKAAAGVTAGAAIISSTTANAVGLGATANDPVAQIGIALTATAGGRLKAFLRAM